MSSSLRDRRRPSARPSPPPRPWRVRATLFAAAWLLLGLQALGLWHGIAHAGLPTVQAAHGAQAVGDTAFGHRDQSADCRLYDLLSHADALGTPVATLPPAATHEAPPAEAVPTPPDARRVASRARGPPAAARA